MSPPRAPRARLSRTARFVGVAAIGVACGGTTTPNDGGTSSDAPNDVTEDFSPGPMYGAVMPDSGVKDSSSNDASDASDASDAETDADASGTALYGAPPPPNGG